MLVAMGLLVAMAGMAMEAIAMISAPWYPVRRRIRLSPLALQSLGFFVWLGGVILAAVSVALRR
jgi:hypothetical protein